MFQIYSTQTFIFEKKKHISQLTLTCFIPVIGILSLPVKNTEIKNINAICMADCWGSATLS